MTPHSTNGSYCGLPLHRTSVTVRVPATTANMGPGFDAIGMALDIWNELCVEIAPKQQIIVLGEGAASLPCDDSNLVIVGMKAAFQLGMLRRHAAGGSSSNLGHAAFEALYAKSYKDVTLPPFRYTCINRIPFARGLGSSSAAVVSGLVAGLVILGIELPVTDEEALLNIACAIEGHPDNVASAIYGGMQIGVKFSTNPHQKQPSERIPQWRTSQVALPSDLECVLFLPDNTTKTAEARAILPAMISRQDAVFNLSRCALLVNALVTGAFHNLYLAMEDRLHQPYRSAAQAKHLDALVDAAVNAGAHAACLSGAGPAVLALTSGSKGDIFTQRQGERRDRAVADAMLRAASQVAIQGRVFITHPTQKGAHVVSACPPLSEGDVCLFGGGHHI